MKLAIGAVLTFFAVALAGQRAEWIPGLIATGQPAPDRFEGAGARLRAELVEVFGQRKLLKRPIPGLAHFFTFWGFVILLTTMAEAYGGLFTDIFPRPAWGILGMLALVIVNLLAYRGARAARGTFPYDDWAFASTAVGRLLDGLSPSALRILDEGFLLAHLAVVLGFLLLVMSP